MMNNPPVPHLAKNYAPVMDEMSVQDLEVTGAIPPELTGWYVRNGPNPQDVDSAHWFFGDGMVHGVRLEGGRATSYRNRWVRTTKFTDGRTTYGDDGTEDLTVYPPTPTWFGTPGAHSPWWSRPSHMNSTSVPAENSTRSGPTTSVGV